MAKKTVRSDKTRQQLQQKFKEALAKRSGGSNLTPEQTQRMFGGALPPLDVRKVINQKSGVRKKSKKAISVRTFKPDRVTTVSPHHIYAAPDWMRKKLDVDVSIVVPVYKSSEHIAEQVKSWDLNDDGLSKEIIYVDDLCPHQTKTKIANFWIERKKDLEAASLSIKVISCESNGGFSSSCNIGAMHASGKYIIFLNADTTVTCNWVKPMIDRLESDPKIGLVGNMQLQGDKIDSCGSEWSWVDGSFLHVGRSIYKGERIPGFSLSNLPSDLKQAQERDMVTGCCFAIPKNLFEDIGGFDISYQIGYWEDAEICMRVKDNGYKVYFEPKSVIQHTRGHSKVGGHPYYRDNQKLFKDRWVYTNRIDEYISNPRNVEADIKKGLNGKVTGCVIACNEEEFLEATVDSVAPIVDDWIFVLGGNEYAYKAGMCDSTGMPSDNTVDIAQKLVKKYGGEVILPPGRVWKDKVEMRNRYAEKLKHGDWMFMVDGDEIYKKNQLWRVRELMQNYECMIFQFWVFWNDMNTIGTGAWEKYPQERVVRWKNGYHYHGKNHLHVANGAGQLVRSIVPTFSDPEKIFYHYSWVRPLEKIRQKLYYYKFQSGNNNDSYVDDVFLKWRENPASVAGKTHPIKPGGGAEPFPGIHPESIQKLIDTGKLDF